MLGSVIDDKWRKVSHVFYMDSSDVRGIYGNGSRDTAKWQRRLQTLSFLPVDVTPSVPYSTLHSPTYNFYSTYLSNDLIHQKFGKESPKWVKKLVETFFLITLFLTHSSTLNLPTFMHNYSYRDQSYDQTLKLLKFLILDWG